MDPKLIPSEDIFEGDFDKWGYEKLPSFWDLKVFELLFTQSIISSNFSGEKTL